MVPFIVIVIPGTQISHLLSSMCLHPWNPDSKKGPNSALRVVWVLVRGSQAQRILHRWPVEQTPWPLRPARFEERSGGEGFDSKPGTTVESPNQYTNQLPSSVDSSNSRTILAYTGFSIHQSTLILHGVPGAPMVSRTGSPRGVLPRSMGPGCRSWRTLASTWT